MKILLVISSLSSGGAERVMTDMANYWGKKGYSVSLVTLNSWVDDFYHLDKKVKRLKFSGIRPKAGFTNKIKFNFMRIIRLRRLIKKNDPDIILSFMDITNITTLASGLGLNKKIVVSERIDPGSNPLLNDFWNVMRKILYRKAYKVIAQTHSAAYWLDKNCNVKSVVIPNPIRPLIKQNVERKQVVVSIGRLDSQKGHDFLIRSFGIVAKNQADWFLDIYGDGPEKDNLEVLIKSLGLESKVCLRGLTNNVEKVLSEAGLFVLSSRYEGFPNVLLEAMSLGCPVVSTNCKSGPSDLIINKENGYLVNVDDVNEMSDVLTMLIDNDMERERIGKAALKTRDLYSQENIMGLWDDQFICY